MKTRPLEPASDWACDAAECGARLPTRTVEAGVDSLEEEAAQADTGDPDTLEELLWRLGGGGEGEVLLHPHHYILIEIAHSLVFAYNSHNRYCSRQKYLGSSKKYLQTNPATDGQEDTALLPHTECGYP